MKRVLPRFLGAVIAMGWLALVLPREPAAADAVLPPARSTSDPVREAPAPLDPSDGRVGELVPDLSLTDLAGKSLRLSDYRRGKALVLCMTGAGCPVAQKYGPVLTELAKAYADKGVTFVAVNPGTAESPAKVKAAADAMGPAVRYVADREGVVGRALAVRSSTEVFVLDAARTLVYRGGIDDQFGLGYAKDKPTHRYLADALDAVLAGNSPVVSATSAPGCALDFTTDAKAAEPKSPITYHNRISRIVQNKCVECHRPGESAPFELLTYDDVVAHKAMMKKVVSRGTMPPWFADPSAGVHWANDRSLSERDRTDLLAWIDAGAPRGDPADAPLPRTWVEGWRIGKPDLVLEATKPFHVPATGTVPYQHTVVSVPIKEDRWVTAMEIRPSHPEVVHHVLAFCVTPVGHPRFKEQVDFKGGLRGYFAGLVPGQGHAVYPAGTAKFLPGGSVLIFQIHYTPNGTACDDRPRIGLVMRDKPPEHEIVTMAASNVRFRIPPGADNHEVTAAYTFKNASRLLSFNPHAHLRGKAFKYDLLFPDGKTQTVLNIPRYDFNWQMQYDLRDPIDVPAGTTLKVTAWYDNSDKNPANPDPTQWVRHGDQTWNEMMIGYFTGYRLDSKTPAAPAGEAEAADAE